MRIALLCADCGVKLDTKWESIELAREFLQRRQEFQDLDVPQGHFVKAHFNHNLSAYDTEKLYGVAWEIVTSIDGIVRQTGFTYTHAETGYDAKKSFVLAHPVQGKSYYIRIVDVAPVVGYHVEDSKGMILSV